MKVLRYSVGPCACSDRSKTHALLEYETEKA